MQPPADSATTPVSAEAAVHAASASLYPWAIVFMLFPVAVLNYLDRMMIATMRASIRADIPSIASETKFGFLMAVFMWVYAAMSPVGGFLADRFSRRWTALASLFVWSLMTWLTGFAQTFTQMAWTRALMGVSEAFYIPAALALIADFHPGATRSRAIGIHTSGIYAGQALGGMGGVIADAGSWRNAFYWFGGAGVIYAIFLMLALREAPRPDHAGQRSAVKLGSSISTLLGTGAFSILLGYFTLQGIPGWAIKNWLPTFLATTFSLKQGPAGMSATGYVTIASFAGALIGGALADMAARKSARGRIYISALGMLFLIPALLGLGNLSSLKMAIGCMMLFGLGFGFVDANNMPILCQLARPQYRATGYGLMNMASIGTGAGVTLAMGAMRDHQIPLGVAFLVSAALAAFALALILFIRPSKEQ